MKTYKLIQVWMTGLCLLEAGCVEKGAHESVRSGPPAAAPETPPASEPAPEAAKPDSAIVSKVQSAAPVAAVSCVDAVRVPGSQASKFRVSGLIGKLPSSGVLVEDETKPSGVGPLSRTPSGQKRMAEQGHLSREQITKVINENLRGVQNCYERNLLKEPGLSGKVVMEWTISTSGHVAVVRTKQNTMHNQAVPMCIMARIKRWKFPRPEGGKVVVSYPFVFKSTDLDRRR